MALCHFEAEVSIRLLLVPLVANLWWKIQGDSDRWDLELFGDFEELSTVFCAKAGSVNSCEFACAQPLAGDQVQDVESILIH